MPGAEHDGHGVGDNRAQNGDALRILAQDAFGDLQHVFQTARRFQYGGAGNDGEDDEHDVHRCLARRHAQYQYLEHQTDTGHHPQTDTAKAAAGIEEAQQEKELGDEREFK